MPRLIFLLLSFAGASASSSNACNVADGGCVAEAEYDSGLDPQSDEAASMEVSLLQSQRQKQPSPKHTPVELASVEREVDEQEPNVSSPSDDCESLVGTGPGSSPCEEEMLSSSLDMESKKVSAQPTKKLMKWQKLGGGHTVFDDEGDDLETDGYVPANKCTDECLKNDECKYVVVCGRDCHMKGVDRKVADPQHKNNYCDAYLYLELTYVPGDPSLLKPSDAPTFTFYMYRSQGPATGPDYPLANVNTASIGGAMWYLHNEVAKDCKYGGKMGSRRFDITRIRRFKVTMKATEPLKKKGMNFGLLKSFDSGEATGPHRSTGWAGTGSGWSSKPEWDQFGYHVGCGNLGEWPHQEFRSGKRYPQAVWYSLPGACPTMNYRKQSAECKVELPGGLCDSVTGQGNCTYSAEDAGEIDINELVGIRDRAQYCRSGCKEADPLGTPPAYKDGDNWTPNSRCGRFWENIWDPVRNELRVKAALDAFHKKYPDMKKEDEMPAPPCDFNKNVYWR